MAVIPSDIELAQNVAAICELRIVETRAGARDINVTLDLTPLGVEFRDPATQNWSKFPATIHLRSDGLVSLPLLVQGAGASPGSEQVLSFHTSDGVDASMHVHVAAPLPSPPTDPVVVPFGGVEVQVWAGEGRSENTYPLSSIWNPSAVDETFHIWWEAPAGWNVSVDATDVTLLGHNGSANLLMHFVGGPRSANGTLFVGSLAAATRIPITATTIPPVSPDAFVVSFEPTNVTLALESNRTVNVSITNRANASLVTSIQACCGYGPPGERAFDEPIVTPVAESNNTSNASASNRSLVWLPIAPVSRTPLYMECDCVGPEIVFGLWQNGSDTFNVTIDPGQTIVLPLHLRSATTTGNTSLWVSATASGETLRGSAMLGIMITDPAADDSVSTIPLPAVPGGRIEKSDDVAEWAALAAATIGAAALVVVASRKKLPLVAAGLYARFAPSRLLEHPARAKLRALVEAQPGITVNDAERASGLSHGAFAHHLQKLETGGLLLSARDGQSRRLFVPGAEPPAVRAPMEERILAIVAKHGTLRPAALAREAGASRQAVHYHVKRLAQQGRLTLLPGGRVTIAATQQPTA